MKLIGSYTSPFVRKISVLLLEKGIAFEFVNDPPYGSRQPGEGMEPARQGAGADRR